jgi:hypothetical protein
VAQPPLSKLCSRRRNRHRPRRRPPFPRTASSTISSAAHSSKC